MKRSAKQSPLVTKKQPFHPPRLIRLGSLRELTRAKLGSTGDGGGVGASMGP